MPNEKVPLSVAVITKNEEKNLPRLLESVSFAAEIVVVDSGSSDRTVEIAKQAGCRVFVEEWKGYGPQKNSAVAKCVQDWVFIIDADERLEKGAAPRLAEAIARPAAVAFTVNRKNFLHGRWIRHSGYWPDRHIRLVRKDSGSFQGAIHEQWVTGGPVRDLDVCVEHYAFSGYTDMLRTMDEYSTVIARDLHGRGRRATAFTPLYHGVGMFLKIYLLERGFLDGLDGLVTAVTKAGGSFFKYAKLRELQRQDEKR